jgi:hypothetical protein
VRDRDALRRIIGKTPPFPNRLPVFIVVARIDLAAAKEGRRDGGVRVRRPKRGKIRYPNKPKSLDKLASQEDLERAAAAARYVPSDYHCPAKGRSRKHRAKPTMPCPREWTICRLQIIVGGKNVTQYTAEHTAGDDHLEIPSYFLAEWLAENWWALLWEPRKNEDTSDHPDFLARHSFLTAQHGFALPKVLIVPAGRAVHVNALPRDVQFADVRFRNLASVWLPRTDVEKDLERFVRSVSERLSGAKISGTSLQEAWELITETTADEIFFCRSMGALGLSPYAQNDAIENVLERAVSTLGERLTLDLCLVSTPENFSDTARIAHLAKASSDNGAEISLEPLARIAETFGAAPKPRGAAQLN